MGVFILKFFLMSTILGGMLKAYIDWPIVHEYPKTIAAIVITICFLLITFAPKFLGSFFKIFLIILLVAGLGFLLYCLTQVDFESKPANDKKEEAVSMEEIEKMEELAQQAKDSLVGIVTSVRSGYLFKVGDSFMKLYAIDGPDPRQTCRDSRDQKYPCGSMSKEALERLILKKEVVCTPVGSDGAHNYIVTCRVGKEDVGAAMVLSGWALADRAVSDVYVPYEKEANLAHKGLWEGKFVAPWDWRKNQPKGVFKKKSKKGKK